MFEALSSDRVALALAGFVAVASGILATPVSADPTPHQLTITKSGTGSGTVTSAPAGIECGSGAGCQASFDDGTDVLLTAVSAPGSWTVLWSGCDGLPLVNQCFVYVNAPREVFAWFGGSEVAVSVDPGPDPDPAPENEAQKGKLRNAPGSSAR